MKIGNVNLNNNIIAAPIASYTNVAFRLLCQELGWGLTTTEFIKIDYLFQQRSFISNEEKQVMVQLMGSNSSEIVRLALDLDEKYPNITLFNINVGCPFGDMIGLNEGCALMEHPRMVGKIIEILVKNLSKPVTIKIRKGVKSNNNTFLELGKYAENKGASAVFFHGRSGDEYYNGKVDIKAIKALNDALNIPVIGNGDIKTRKDYIYMCSLGLPGVMIGRAMLKNPMIINEIMDSQPVYTAVKLLERYLELGQIYHNVIDFERFKNSIMVMGKECLELSITELIKIKRSESYSSIKSLIKNR